MSRYVIRPGHSFELAGGQVATGGEQIELADDVAALHADKVDPVQPSAPAVDPAPGSSSED